MRRIFDPNSGQRRRAEETEQRFALALDAIRHCKSCERPAFNGVEAGPRPEGRPKAIERTFFGWSAIGLSHQTILLLHEASCMDYSWAIWKWVGCVCSISGTCGVDKYWGYYGRARAISGGKHGGNVSLFRTEYSKEAKDPLAQAVIDLPTITLLKRMSARSRQVWTPGNLNQRE